MSRAKRFTLAASVVALALVPNAAQAAPPDDSPCQKGGVQCAIYRVNCIIRNAGGNLGPCVWPE